MLRHFKAALFGVFVIAGLASAVAFSPQVGAASVIDAACTEDPTASICQSNVNNSADGLAKNIINLLLFIVGAISVVMIIVGGLLYVTSAGDGGKVTTAKNTLMYAVIGLVVSFVAFAIVQFVISKF